MNRRRWLSPLLTVRFAIFLVVFAGVANTSEANEKLTANSKTTLVSYGIDLYGFEDALLAHIMSYTSENVSIGRYPGWLPRGREFALMSSDQGIDVVWGSATEARFAKYLPVKIPIYKGLIGWRLGLVKQKNFDSLKNVNTINDLRGFSPGQHFNWSDYKIYKANGFNIASGANRDALAEMLALERFDFFPRSVIEIEKELHDFAEMDIALEPHILIKYKSAYVFYVAQGNDALATKLEMGLRKAKADGSFDRLFEFHFKSLFERLDLPNRKIIQLSNPLLPAAMLNIDEHFWISPKALLVE